MRSNLLWNKFDLFLMIEFFGLFIRWFYESSFYESQVFFSKCADSFDLLYNGLLFENQSRYTKNAKIVTIFSYQKNKKKNHSNKNKIRIKPVTKKIKSNFVGHMMYKIVKIKYFFLANFHFYFYFLQSGREKSCLLHIFTGGASLL